MSLLLEPLHIGFVLSIRTAEEKKKKGKITDQILEDDDQDMFDLLVGMCSWLHPGPKNTIKILISYLSGIYREIRFF